ncbi:MAG TPA: Gfo/Idh/MocA family oxidoreductase [Polyangiaceae bacterium]|jgi:predicted dehydrogenase|nr:Gfo/Idh/MocA family oxidoreductase [Polyangiaceae bacterium]
MTRSLRIAVVGVGNVGGSHARELLLGKVRGASLAAVCDSNPAALARFAGVPGFASQSQLLAAGLADAVLIATPHYDHTPLSIEALAAGLHVLVEKPLAVHTADAASMLAAYARRPNRGQLFAEMLVLRSDPRFLRLRALIETGELGALRRLHWTITDCLRTDAYYRSGGWRATWGGEGGGVLLNQCPHQLDLWQWLFGMPARVHAFCGFGRLHPIAVEDQVTAYLEYESGTNGVFIASTGEAPGSNVLEVVGDLGTVVVDRHGLKVTRNGTSTLELLRTGPARVPRADARVEEIPLAHGPSPLTAMIQNFVNAILEGEALIAPASEGLSAVELANAMIFSGITQRTVELPLDPALYVAELARLIQRERS